MHSSSGLENKAIESNHHAVVLVVDDDPLQRGEIVEFIARQGIQVITEDNGFAAYHRIKKSKPRVIVMDMKMPGLDGIHVSRLVKNLDFKPKCPSEKLLNHMSRM